MKFKLILITLVAVFLFDGINLKAQTAPPDPAPSHLKAAEDYLIATGINTKFEAITESIISTLSKQIPENNRAAIVSVMQKFMQKYYTWDLLKGEMSKIYANEFTEDELKQLTVFFNTPLGQKYGDKMVILTQKGMQIGQKLIMDHQSELAQMMKDAMPGDKN